MVVTVEIKELTCKVDNEKWTCKNKAFQRHLNMIERRNRAVELFETSPDKDEKSAMEIVEYFKDLGLDAKIIDLGPAPEGVKNRIY